MLLVILVAALVVALGLLILVPVLSTYAIGFAAMCFALLLVWGFIKLLLDEDDPAGSRMVPPPEQTGKDSRQ